MGRNVQNEMSRRGEGTLVVQEPKRMMSRKEKAMLEKLPQAEPEENKPLANLNRLKEFNGLFNGCMQAAQNRKDGRKAERLRESSERIRLYLVDSLRTAGIRVDWQCGFLGIQSTWEAVRGQLWREREHMNVIQIQESVRAMTSRLFELPSEGWKEFETALENLRRLKSI